MKFLNNFINKSPLYIAVEKQNIEIIKQLIELQQTDVNAKAILTINFFYVVFNNNLFLI